MRRVSRDSIPINVAQRLGFAVARSRPAASSKRVDANRRIKNWKCTLPLRQAVPISLLIQGGFHEEGTSRRGCSCGSDLRASGDDFEPSSASCLSRATADRLYEIWLPSCAGRLLSHRWQNVGRIAERLRRHGLPGRNSLRAPVSRTGSRDPVFSPPPDASSKEAATRAASFRFVIEPATLNFACHNGLFWHKQTRQ